MIGSLSLFGAGNYYQGVNAAKNTEGSAALTDSQRFTQRHAGLSASDYISSYLEFSEQKSAELLKSGEATDTFSVRFNDRTFTLAGKKLGALQAAGLSDALAVQVVKPADVPRAPGAAAGRVDLTA